MTIGQSVIGKKNGNGTITKLTGYVEEAKAIRQRIYIDARLNYALQQETGRTGSTQFLKSI